MSPPNDWIVQTNGVDLCVETFGDPAAPAIMLVHGSSASMDWWEDEFCTRLAAGSRFVIRYDHRDTGRSVSYEPGAPQYTFGDLVADSIGVLDALGVGRAHLVGLSMGGAIVQLAALDHPDRVASLVLISTGPATPGEDPDLPGMSDEDGARFAEAPTPDWRDRAAVIDYGTYLARVSASRSRPFDDTGMRALWDRVLDRTTNIESSFRNHNAVLGDGGRWRERLGQLRIPAVVVHGTEDPVVPYGNGVALASDIPRAKLVTLEQTGHELPREDWDVVVPAIIEHTSRS